MTLEKLMEAADQVGIPNGNFAEAIQERYQSYLDSGLIQKLLTLYKLTGIKPMLAKKEVQQSYADNASFVWQLRDLYSATGIKPRIPQNKTDKAYNFFIEDGSVDYIAEFMELTGTRLSDEHIQSTYEYFINRGWHHRLEELNEVTGVEISEEVVQRCYVNYLKVSSKVLTHSSYVFQDKAGFIAEDREEREGIISQFKRLFKFTGVVPKVPVDLVEKTYRLLAKSGSTPQFKILREITGVEPSPEAYQILVKVIFRDRLENKPPQC